MNDPEVMERIAEALESIARSYREMAELMHKRI